MARYFDPRDNLTMPHATGERIGYLDSIRGIAILLVVMVHVSSGVTLSISEYWDQFMHAGGKGVPLFFMLSGFALFMQYERNKENFSWRGFYTRRIFRIMPLWLLMIPVYILFKWPISISDIWGTIFFYNGALADHKILIDGGWSIYNEIIFYSLFPILIVLCKTRWRTTIVFLILAAISIIYRYSVWGAADFLYEQPMSHLYSFVMGIGLYQYSSIYRKLKIPNFVAILSLLIITYVVKFDIIVACLGFSILFILGGHKGSYISSILNKSRWLISIGHLSYGIYITHFIVIKLTRYADVRGLNMVPNLDSMNPTMQFFNLSFYFIEVFIISYLIAFAIYYLYEVKFIKLGHYLVKTYKI